LLKILVIILVAELCNSKRDSRIYVVLVGVSISLISFAMVLTVGCTDKAALLSGKNSVTVIYTAI